MNKLRALIGTNNAPHSREALHSLKNTEARQPPTQIINLLHQLDSDADCQRIAVHSREKVKLLSSADVLYIEADSRYCCIYLSNKERYTTARHMKEFEQYFGEHSSFIRISKTFMINTRHIREYSKGEPFIIELSNGAEFEVSRRKKAEVLDKLKRMS